MGGLLTFRTKSIMHRVQIAYAYVNHFTQKSSLSTLLDCLPAKLHTDILRYKFEKDRYTRAIGKYLLLKQLEELGYEATVLQRLEKNAFDKPFLKNTPLAFSIAHSEDLVLCAITSEAQLGVDVEYIKQIDITIFQDQFNPAEWKNIQADASLHAFYNYWTRKESIIKADGRGLQIPLSSFDTTQAIVQLNDTPTQWHLQPLNLDPCYKVHLCTNPHISRVNVKKYLCDW